MNLLLCSILVEIVNRLVRLFHMNIVGDELSLREILATQYSGVQWVSTTVAHLGRVFNAYVQLQHV